MSLYVGQVPLLTAIEPRIRCEEDTRVVNYLIVNATAIITSSGFVGLRTMQLFFISCGKIRLDVLILRAKKRFNILQIASQGVTIIHLKTLSNIQVRDGVSKSWNFQDWSIVEIFRELLIINGC